MIHVFQDTVIVDNCELRHVLQLVSACLDTCCSHFLTIIAGVDLHFRHESELPHAKPGD